MEVEAEEPTRISASFKETAKTSTGRASAELKITILKRDPEDGLTVL